MGFHKETLLKIREIRERAALNRERRRETQELISKQRFEREKVRLEREGELEIGRARIRKTQEIARPKGATTGGISRGAFAGFQNFASDFARRQEPTTGQVGRLQVRRTKPRVAARGRVLFEQSGRPVSVRNAPSVRRRRKSRMRIGQAQPQNPFAPSGMV